MIHSCFLLFFIENWIFEYYTMVTLELRFFPSVGISVFDCWKLQLTISFVYAPFQKKIFFSKDYSLSCVVSEDTVPLAYVLLGFWKLFPWMAGVKKKKIFLPQVQNKKWIKNNATTTINTNHFHSLQLTLWYDVPSSLGKNPYYSTFTFISCLCERSAGGGSWGYSQAFFGHVSCSRYVYGFLNSSVYMCFQNTPISQWNSFQFILHGYRYFIVYLNCNLFPRKIQGFHLTYGFKWWLSLLCSKQFLNKGKQRKSTCVSPAGSL